MASDQFLEDIIVAQSPYPRVLRDGALLDGTFVLQPDICRTCRNHRCAVAEPSSGEFEITVCYKGVGIVLFRIGSSAGVLNGLSIEKTANRIPRVLKKGLSPWRVSPSRLLDWHRRAQATLQQMRQRYEEIVQETLSTFHDVQTSVSTILRSSERLVAQQAGATTEEKFEQLPPAAQALIKSVELLQARLKLMPLLSNPASAGYGTKRPRRIYATIDFLVRTLRPVALQRRVNVVLSGKSYNTPATFESFDTVPLVIVENAIKYSREDQTVEVEVNDEGRGGVRVTISSFSPFIPETERERMFDRGVRGKASLQVADKGSGIGLYLAKVVADAHGFRVMHSCDNRDMQIDGVRYCHNSFSFLVN